MAIDRREFLRLGAAAAVGAGTVPVAGAAAAGAGPQGVEGRPDYTLRIATGLVELAPQHIVSTTLYNGQFRARCCASRKARAPSSTFTTRRIRRSCCTGTGR